MSYTKAKGLDPEKVSARKAALIAAGPDPLLAEKLAQDAETNQASRDAFNEAADKEAAKAAKDAKAEKSEKKEAK